LKIEKVECAWSFSKKATFAEFVNHFYGLRLEAKATGDKLNSILYKLILNSAYGKFALNPRKFKEWLLTVGEIPNGDQWTLHSNGPGIYIWERPSPRAGGFYNIAAAASITGAARANLLLNIHNSTRPIYCDTDSILCENFSGDLDETRLGAWKIEATGNMAAIAGKKLYALFDGETVLKKASKGCQLSATEILKLCKGKVVTYHNAAPSFHLHGKGQHSLGDLGSADFITRNIRSTGK
jgi:DNA polymerase elongation subunit (family B)